LAGGNRSAPVARRRRPRSHVGAGRRRDQRSSVESWRSPWSATPPPGGKSVASVRTRASQRPS